ncbi:MAG TPA: metallophosphoesterase [Bacteroidales bacterium]|nr:metallophosphoesterase [Bacteroidales bacterium]
MKTVSIGDTHGVAVADVVVKIIDRYDKLIFAGDYVDSFIVDNITMKKNLLGIIELKKRYPEKVILLWGNHDIHYLLGNKHYCSGYRPEMHYDFYDIFHSNEHLFQLSFQINDYIWTHAGVNAKWFDQRFGPFAEEHNYIHSVSELLNLAFTERYEAIFDVGYRRGGNYEVGGPLWCDTTELRKYPFKEFNQIAGHNPVKEIEILETENKEIVLIDVLESNETVDPSYFYYKEI